jgi:hypothetical protein
VKLAKELNSCFASGAVPADRPGWLITQRNAMVTTHHCSEPTYNQFSTPTAITAKPTDHHAQMRFCVSDLCAQRICTISEARRARRCCSTVRRKGTALQAAAGRKMAGSDAAPEQQTAPADRARPNTDSAAAGRKLRILCLHGYQQNAEVQSNPLPGQCVRMLPHQCCSQTHLHVS